MILCYSVSTGLCGLSTGPWDYIIYCFITGVGAGGIFPIACTLVAESLPDRTRPQALGMVQTFSALGNIGAGAISLGFVALLGRRLISTHWRWMFSVGIVPSLLAIIVARRLREPEAWKRAAAEGKAREGGPGRIVLRSPLAAERDRRPVAGGLRRGGPLGNRRVQQRPHAVHHRRPLRQAAVQAGEGDEGPPVRRPGDSLARRSCRGKEAAMSSRGTCWAATRTTRQRRRADLQGGTRSRRRKARRSRRNASWPACRMPTANRCADVEAETAATSGNAWPHAARRSRSRTTSSRIIARQKARNIEVLQWAAWTLICFNVGAFFGMYAFARVTQSIGRRPTFAIFFTIAMVTTALAFGCMEEMPHDLWMVALMGGRNFLSSAAMRSTSRNCSPRDCGAPARRSATTSGVTSLRSVRWPWPAETEPGQQAWRSGAGLPLRRRGDVLVFPGGARGTAVRPGDEGTAAAGVKLYRRMANVSNDRS